MESQPQNLELRNNPDKLHPCIINFLCDKKGFQGNIRCAFSNVTAYNVTPSHIRIDLHISEILTFYFFLLIKAGNFAVC